MIVFIKLLLFSGNTIASDKDTIPLYKYKNHKFSIGYNVLNPIKSIFNTNKLSDINSILFSKSFKLEAEKKIYDKYWYSVEIKFFQTKDSYVFFDKVIKSEAYTPAIGIKKYWYNSNRIMLGSRIAAFHHYLILHFEKSNNKSYNYTGLIFDNEIVLKLSKQHNLSINTPNLSLFIQHIKDNRNKAGFMIDAPLINYKINF